MNPVFSIQVFFYVRFNFCKTPWVTSGCIGQLCESIIIISIIVIIIIIIIVIITITIMIKSDNMILSVLVLFVCFLIG